MTFTTHVLKKSGEPYKMHCATHDRLIDALEYADQEHNKDGANYGIYEGATLQYSTLEAEQDSSTSTSEDEIEPPDIISETRAHIAKVLDNKHVPTLKTIGKWLDEKDCDFETRILKHTSYWLLHELKQHEKGSDNWHTTQSAQNQRLAQL